MRRCGAAATQELLHLPIFERVERDNNKSAAGRQYLLGGGEPACDLAKLVIDRDPQPLEGTGRRVLSWLGSGDRGAYDLGEFGRAEDRPPLPRCDDRAGDAARKSLFAEVANQIRKLRL